MASLQSFRRACLAAPAGPQQRSKSSTFSVFLNTLTLTFWFILISIHSQLLTTPFSSISTEISRLRRPTLSVLTRSLCSSQNGPKTKEMTTIKDGRQLSTSTSKNRLGKRTRLTSLSSRGRAAEDRRSLAAFRDFRDLSGSSMWSSNSSGRFSGLILNAISFTLRRATPRTLLEPGRGQRCRTG